MLAYLYLSFVAGGYLGFKLAQHLNKKKILQRMNNDIDARINAKDKLVFVNFGKKKIK